MNRAAIEHQKGPLAPDLGLLLIESFRPKAHFLWRGNNQTISTGISIRKSMSFY